MEWFYMRGVGMCKRQGAAAIVRVKATTSGFSHVHNICDVYRSAEF